MDAVEIPLIGQPQRWIVCFDRKIDAFWKRLVPGRHKHVQAFGHVPGMDLWLFYSVRLRGTVIAAATGEGARKLMREWMTDADVLGFVPCAAGRPGGIGFYCVPAVAHLLGLANGAFFPSGLYRLLRHHGAVVIDDHGPSAVADRPDVRSTASASTARPDHCAPE